MSTRNQILEAIHAGKPAPVPLPDNRTIVAATGNLVHSFRHVLQGIGGSVEMVQPGALFEKIAELAQHPVRNLLLENELKNISFDELEQTNTAVMRGSLAVAENAGVWVWEKDMGHRALPFLCQHLVLVVQAKDMVQDMDAAYEAIDITSEGFGVFIAGPSKTADIEQSLVIGAHGPLSLQVWIME